MFFLLLFDPLPIKCWFRPMSVAGKNYIRFLSALLLLGCIVVFGACLPEGPVTEAEKPKKDKKSLGVLAVMISVKETPLIHQTKGEIIPSNHIEILAPFSGTISKVVVHEGQKISAGAQVVRFDNELAQAKLELVNAEEEEATAAIDLDEYRFDNRDELLEEEEISSLVFDMLEKKLEYEKARAKRAKTESGYLQKVTQKSDIISSIAGIVTNRSVADGMQVAEGQFLMEIVQNDPVKLKVRLPEEYIPATHKGQLLQIKYNEIPEEQSVKISDVGAAVDPLTRTFDVFAKLDNPDGKLKTGMEISTTLATDKKTKTLSIPKSAVALQGKKLAVFRIENGIAKSVLVRLGEPSGGEVVVLKGLVEGDIIVLDPPRGLKDGDKVDIMTAAAETAETTE
jgi:RND family efflux transporter MFP subunit